ncbi:metallophosphoesterase [Nonomuraea cavernae]|uniref:metallophosphoesterase n=1 Tax=Nonomuraea cavernae TaxID=2045107 RepID=UPI0033F9B25F
MIVGFVGMVITVVIAVHVYLWHRLVRSTTRRGRARRALTWGLVGLGALVPVTFAGTRSEWGHWLAWPGYLWLAIMFYLLVFLVVLEIPRAVAWLLIRRSLRAKTSQPPVAVPVAARSTVSSPSVASGSAGEAARDASPVASAGQGDSSGGEPVGQGDSSGGEPAGQGDSSGGEPVDEAMSRRLFLGRTTAAIAGVSALGTVGYGIRTALGDPVIEPVKIVLPNLDPRLSGLRFAVVSDIHLGPLTGRAHAERIVRMINSLRPDVVAIVGDMVDGTVAELGALARPFADLEASYGSYFVTGNHEYYTANGPTEWIDELQALGVRSLRNERVEIRHQGGVLDLAGVNDVTGTTMDDGPDFDRALGGRDTTRSTVLLAHQPIQVEEAARHKVDLQLSGHTHGGQMVPFNLVVPLQQPAVTGLSTIDGVQVYVTRGAGFWGPPVRVGAPPEITLAELR